MKLLFRQRMFSWFDSYDIYDSNGNTLFTVKGELAWGRLLRIYDAGGNAIGYLKQRVFTLLHQFEIYKGEAFVGTISERFALFKTKFDIDFNGWRVDGNFVGWNYSVTDASGEKIATVSYELFKWADSYVIDVKNSDDALLVLMIALAIDADVSDRRS